MGGHCPHLGGTARQQQFGGGDHGATRVDHVVGDDAHASGDLADDLFGFGHVHRALGAALVDEGDVGVHVAEVLGETLGNLHPAGIGRHDDHAVFGVLAYITFEHRQCGEVVDWAIKEALNLTAMEIDRDHSLGASGTEQVGHKAGSDWLTAFGLAVLAGVTIERTYGGDALC